MVLALPTTSVRLAAVSISMAASLQELGAAKTLFASLAPSTPPVAVSGVLTVGNVVIWLCCARNAAREDQEDRSKFGPRNAKKQHTATDKLARNMAFRACRLLQPSSVRWCLCGNGMSKAGVMDGQARFWKHCWEHR
jgi:hypothetical protein